MKHLVPWLVIGLLVRLVLIPTALHPDIRGHNLAAYFISQQGKLLTFYDQLRQLPRTDHLVQLYQDGLFIYPPLAYWAHAVFMWLTGPMLPWDTFWLLINDIGQVRTAPGFALLMYLLKLPYLVADILGLIIIWRLVPIAKRFWASILWIFNPVTIYASYMVAQFDIYIAVLILLAALMYNKNKSVSALALGLAAGFKPFPLVLLPFLGETLRDKIKLILIGLVTYGLLLVPYLNSTGFKHYALFASQSDKPFYAKVMVSGSQYLPLFVVGLVMLYWWRFYRPQRLAIASWLATPLLLFYSLTHFHPQWFVWVTPLLILALVSRPKIWPLILTVLTCIAIVIFSFENSLNFGLFGIPITLQVSDYFVSLTRGLLAGTSLFLLQQFNDHT